jgi:putative spermidine/putrescine transport system permease protein
MSSTVKADRFALAGFLAISAVPAVAALLYAALYSIGAVGLLSSGVTLRPWARVLASAELWSSFRLSVTVAAGAVVLAAAVGLLLALALRGRLEGALGVLLHLPLTVPAVVAGFLTFQLLSAGGLVQRLAARLGLVSDAARFPALVQEPGGLGIALAHGFLAFPFFALLFSALLRSERIADYEELAASLGAGRRQILLRVTLPILLRGALPALLLTFIVILGSYDIPLLLGVQSPQMLSVLVMRKSGLYDLAERPEAFCIAVVYSLVVLVLLWRVIPVERGDPVGGNRETR